MFGIVQEASQLVSAVFLVGNVTVDSVFVALLEHCLHHLGISISEISLLMIQASSSWPASPRGEADSDNIATILLDSNFEKSSKGNIDRNADTTHSFHGSRKGDDFDNPFFVSSDEIGEVTPRTRDETERLESSLLNNALAIDDEEHSTGTSTSTPPPSKPRLVTWSSLPRKDQLAILTLARLSEPLTQTSLQSYMFYQLRSFSPAAPDSTISWQAGLLQAAFTGAQFCTAIMWGRLADWEGMGRKKVLLIGLLGTAVGAAGFGFSGSFKVAFFWRVVGGALNGNIGVMRTVSVPISVSYMSAAPFSHIKFPFPEAACFVSASVVALTPRLLLSSADSPAARQNSNGTDISPHTDDIRNHPREKIPIQSISSSTHDLQHWCHNWSDPGWYAGRPHHRLSRPIRAKIDIWRR